MDGWVIKSIIFIVIAFKHGIFTIINTLHYQHHVTLSHIFVSCYRSRTANSTGGRKSVIIIADSCVVCWETLRQYVFSQWPLTQKTTHVKAESRVVLQSCYACVVSISFRWNAAKDLSSASRSRYDGFA